MEFAPPFPGLYPVLRSLLKEAEQIFLVGGVVRDILLNREPNDIDIIVSASPGQVKTIARKTANHFHGGLFALDEERSTYRVLVKDENGKDWKIDIALMRGETLEADLRSRDFTVNAIAVDVTSETIYTLIDPTGGASDLLQKKLLPVTSHSLADDSIRVVRGIRMALEFGLQIDEAVFDAMKKAVPELSKVSGERFRDEFFRMLNHGNAKEGFDLLSRLGVFGVLFNQPGVCLSTDTAHALTNLDQLSQTLQHGEPVNSRIKDMLDGFQIEGLAYLDGCVSADRSRLALLKLACLLSAIPEYETKVKYFAFSQQEQNYLMAVIHNSDKLVHDTSTCTHWERKDTYRFYKMTCDAGPAVCFTVLARAGFASIAERPALWSVCQTLLSSYFHSYSTLINPEPLLDGNAIMELLQLPPGPQIGKYLEILKEAQVSGNVHTQEDAIWLLKTELKNDAGNHIVEASGPGVT